MKKIFIFGLLSLFIFSCSTEIKTENEKRNQKVLELLQEDNYDVKRLMYNLLSANEKFILWDGKIDELLSNEFLTEKQRTILSDLKNNMNEEIFDESVINDKREIFKNNYVAKFLKVASLDLNSEFIYNNFFTLPSSSISSTNPIVYIGEPDTPVDGIVTCGCNIGSIWSCGMQPENCKKTSKCNDDTKGCGFMGMFECNGNCFLQ